MNAESDIPKRLADAQTKHHIQSFSLSSVMHTVCGKNTLDAKATWTFEVRHREPERNPLPPLRSMPQTRKQKVKSLCPSLSSPPLRWGLGEASNTVTPVKKWKFFCQHVNGHQWIWFWCRVHHPVMKRRGSQQWCWWRKMSWVMMMMMVDDVRVRIMKQRLWLPLWPPGWHLQWRWVCGSCWRGRSWPRCWRRKSPGRTDVRSTCPCLHPPQRTPAQHSMLQSVQSHPNSHCNVTSAIQSGRTIIPISKPSLPAMLIHLSCYVDSSVLCWFTCPMLIQLSCYVDSPVLLCWFICPAMLIHLSCYVDSPVLLCWVTCPAMLSHLSCYVESPVLLCWFTCLMLQKTSLISKLSVPAMLSHLSYLKGLPCHTSHYTTRLSYLEAGLPCHTSHYTTHLSHLEAGLPGHTSHYTTRLSHLEESFASQ